VCGLCGELRFDGSSVVSQHVQTMLTRLEHRGPDNDGLYCHGGIGLGHRRLAVIDLSTHAHQPMQDESRQTVLVFNGAIYNYPTVRANLIAKGYQFRSTGDTEVILHAWHEWAEQCVDHLDGMFAFAIWDGRRRCLFLARDRFGIKPLYWSATARVFRFASTPQALLALGDVKTDLDPIALHHAFTLHAVVPAPHTLLTSIRKVRPAHWLRMDADGRQTEHCYWQLNATRPAVERDEAAWVHEIEQALRAAVHSHQMIADVPVGVLLSGGLDSSLLVALLAEAGADPLHTFSIGFEDTPEEAGHEFHYSDQIVDRYGTHHERILIPNREVLQRLPAAVDAMSEPMFAQDAVAFYLLAEQVARHIKVVQSGQGADEVFGGYFWYPRIAADSRNNALTGLQQHYFDRDHHEYQQMITEDYQVGDVTSAVVAEALAQPGATTVMDAVLRLDVCTFIVDDPVKRVDNMTMAWGLEARVPFLDRQLVEVAARCPVEMKLRDGGKYPLKVLARGRIPDAVIDRPKGYFPMPALKYVRGEFFDFMHAILQSSTCRNRGLYRRDYVTRLLDEPTQHHTRIQGSKLWHLAVLEFWLQRHGL
jgi:asparagine synthase (glutamine-hydrolysing)